MRIIRTTALVAALLLVGAGCGGSDSTGESSSPTTADVTTSVDGDSAPTTTASPTTEAPTTEAPTTTEAAPTDTGPAEGEEYVALGSSIASGFGISVQSPSCGRSDRNYPNLVADRFGLVLTDVSCGAAVIPNVVDTAQGDNPPQLDVVTTDTALITVTVGGNDIAYNGTALGCSNPEAVCEPPANLDTHLAELRPLLTDMIERIRAAAPDATIVLVTYPREFPDENCPELSLADEELSMLRSMGEELEAAFVDVAAETGVILVDPYSEPADHTGCAPEPDRWVSGATPADGDGFAFHPTALGHEVMAEMIAAALTG